MRLTRLSSALATASLLTLFAGTTNCILAQMVPAQSPGLSSYPSQQQNYPSVPQTGQQSYPAPAQQGYPAPAQQSYPQNGQTAYPQQAPAYQQQTQRNVPSSYPQTQQQQQAMPQTQVAPTSDPGGMPMPMNQTNPQAGPNLRQREIIDRDRPLIKRYADDANKACGSKVNFLIDYNSYLRLLDSSQEAPSSYLGNVAAAIKGICKTPEGREAVKNKIKAVTVTHGNTESMSLTDSQFHYIVPYGTHTPDTAYAWLHENL